MSDFSVIFVIAFVNICCLNTYKLQKGFGGFVGV